MTGLSNIYARNCTLRRIDSAEADAFLSRSHRLGSTRSRYRYGLYVRRRTGRGEAALEAGTLVAVATFSGARRWQKGERRISSYEWLRYASLPGIRVTGGMGRLLRAFMREVHPDDIMSYAPVDSPDGGNAYRVLGFVEEGTKRGDGFESIKFRLRLSAREAAA